MICTGCGKTLAEDEPCHMVAHWHFCEPCFQRLLEQKTTQTHNAPASEASQLKDEEQEEKVAETDATNTDASTCSMCGAPLDNKASKVGIWRFCHRCRLEMSPPPTLKPEPEQDPEIIEEPEPSGPSPATIIVCSGCGRRIPLGGTKDVLGKRYCPECFVVLSPGED